MGEERVGALSLTGTTVTVMVVFWGGWLVGGGSGEGGVGEKELGGGEGMNYKGRAVIYKHPCTKQGMFYTCHQTKPCLTCCTTRLLLPTCAPPILTQPYPTGTRVHSRTAH